jgi:hypothetical protein
MINELYEQLKLAFNKEERGKVTPNEFNIALPLILNEIYNDSFIKYRSLINKRNKYLLGAGNSDDTLSFKQIIEYYLVANHNLTITSGKGQIPKDLFYIDSVVNDKRIEYNKLSLDKFNLMISSSNKPSGCYPSYTMYGDAIEIFPVGTVKLNYFRKIKKPKWTYVLINEKESFNPDANDFQDIDMHSSKHNEIFNQLLIYFGISRKDNQIQQAGALLISEDTQKSNAT